ncbi:hypothetical protein FHT44_004249 [Mycolicibacterium sp. BK634]|uniref:hypothetical protein n=1 Tax=Mycolicibacterium sp. BK634 TaxID=2587099 RepID=UPI001615067D|nr:hypothetical protein [Mycolicibacterium sp. BK634]MBB3751754.1 hypothetical protein [Mycolicibacterium sp. BK634]
MQLALNRTVTAGVTLVGASAIALTPIVAYAPAIQLPSIRSAEVQMAAFVNPIEEWVQVIGTSFTNLSALGTQVQTDPTPILSKLASNFLANASTVVDTASTLVGQAVATFAGIPQGFFDAATQLAAGHISEAVQTIWGTAILPPVFLAIIPISAAIPIIQTAVQNVANVIGALGGVNLLLTGIAVISPIYATITQFGNSAQAVFDAASAGDLVTAASEFINAPAKLVNAFLNGDDTTPGLLTPLDGVGGGGAIAALLKLRDAIADAIVAPAPPAAAAAKTLSAKVAAPAEATTTTAKTDDTTATTTGATKAHSPVTSGSKTAGGGKKAGGTSSSHGEKSSGKAGSARHRGAA